MFFDKIRLYFTINETDKEDIIEKGYGIPIKVLSNNKGTCFSHIEWVPDGLNYDNVYFRESVYLTDKNNKVKVSRFSANNCNRCVYCQSEISLVY